LAQTVVQSIHAFGKCVLGGNGLRELAFNLALRLEHVVESGIGVLGGRGAAQRNGDDERCQNDANRQYYQGNFHDERRVPLTVKRTATISGA
jgi:hypothetical protein